MKPSTARKQPSWVFIDTSFFKALLDARDEFHQAAEKIWQKIRDERIRAVTSNYILDESFTLLRKRCGMDLVKKFRDDLAITKTISITRVTLADEASAWRWFVNDWSNLSFTDCVSFAVMERLDLRRVATFDRHFSQAGFEIA